MVEEKKQYKMKLVGWTAYYADKAYSSYEGHEWKNIPRDDMKLLQRFYQIYDEKGDLYIKDGHDTFHELVHGHSLIALSVDGLKTYKKLPKEIKFMDSISELELEFIKQRIEGKDGTEQRNELQTNAI